MQLLNNLLVIWTCAGFVTFCLLYGFLAPWYRSETGRNIMALMGACGLFLVLAIVRMVNRHAFDDWPWLRPVVWLTIGSIAWWRVVLLIKTQVTKRRIQRVRRR